MNLNVFRFCNSNINAFQYSYILFHISFISFAPDILKAKFHLTDMRLGSAKSGKDQSPAKAAGKKGSESPKRAGSAKGSGKKSAKGWLWSLHALYSSNELLKYLSAYCINIISSIQSILVVDGIEKGDDSDDGKLM